MLALEELKKLWEKEHSSFFATQTYDNAALEKLIRKRVGTHARKSFQYFWATLALQILVYAMLSHVIIKYWHDREILFYSISGILLFLPFTVMLMRKFKSLAISKPYSKQDTVTSLHDYIFHQQTLLRNFYNFKRRYEFILIPCIVVIGSLLVFKIYVPGGINENITGVVITSVISLLSCAAAIRAENKKNFEEPIDQLQNILNEFKS